MALTDDATRVTRDVDSLCVPHDILLEETGNIAREQISDFERDLSAYLDAG